MAPISSEILAKNAKLLTAWTLALKARDCKVAHNVDEHIKIDHEELEVEREGVQTAEDLIGEFDTGLEEQGIISAEMEKLTSHWDGPVLAELEEYELNDALQVVYDASKEAVKHITFNLVGDVTVDISERENGLTDHEEYGNPSPYLKNFWTHYRDALLDASGWSRQWQCK